ncbi:MAG: MotE family protein [Dissulfurimicrobium sp.]|uniref:MotE family protein n=1 Tax=Dissulfurimicrobium sp. TaxID=2022436 RepID=UPI004049DC5B
MSKNSSKRGVNISIHALGRLLISVGVMKAALMVFFFAVSGFNRASAIEATNPSSAAQKGLLVANSNRPGNSPAKPLGKTADNDAGQPAPSQTGPALAIAGTDCRPEVLQVLNARLRELGAKQSELEKKSKDLDLVKNELDTKIKELKDLKTDLEGSVNTIKSASQSEFQHMIDIYSFMDPQKAAAMLDKMDDRTVIQMFKGMKSKKVAQIMSFMDTDRAARVGAELTKPDFGRNSATPQGKEP